MTRPGVLGPRARVVVRRYVAGDVALLGPACEALSEEGGAGLADLMEGGTPGGGAWTLTNRGRVQACAGLVPIWNGRLEAWAVVACERPALFGHFFRACRDRLDAAMEAGVWRIEAHVRRDFPKGHRFILALGFAREGVARRWGPDGSDYVAYAKVRP